MSPQRFRHLSCGREVHQQILPRLERIMSAIKKSSMFAAVFLGLFVSSAGAQGVMTVTVPFPFVVDHREFPAGRYEIRNVENAGTVLSIEGINNRSGAFVFTMAAGGGDPAGNEPSLVFTHEENQYQLSEIWESPTVGTSSRRSRITQDRAAGRTA
jgi:hypothetical protein